MAKTAKAEKVKLTGKQKGLKALKIIAIIFGCIIVLIAAMFITDTIIAKKERDFANSFDKVSYVSQLTPRTDSDGMTTFFTDSNLKVLQITDTHIGAGFLSYSKDKKALNCIASMVTAEKPDLVVFTGDMVYPAPQISGSLNNKQQATVLTALMENLGVYWTVVFGNHDTEAYALYSREDMASFYSDKSLKYCLFEAGSDAVDGQGNYVINVKNNDSVITQSLIFLDSHSYPDSDKWGWEGDYDNIHANQIAWYKGKIKQLNKENQTVIEKLGNPKKYNSVKNVKSLLFYHIPSQVYTTAWEDYESNKSDAQYLFGEKLEETCSPSVDDELFNTILELGSTKGIFCGHDHVNNFAIKYKGVQLTYGYSVDYLAYAGISKQGSQRGCTEIICKPDGTFESTQKNYYDKVFVSKYPKETVVM